MSAGWIEWIGRTETRSDQVTAAPMAGLAATLDRDDPYPEPGDPVPPLWHWLFFLPRDRGSDLGPDGHRRRGGFLPPSVLPRRMWAGSLFEFIDPLRVGDQVTRLSRIVNVQEKDGRSGPLLFVRVRREISSPRGLALVELHDIVYRDHPRPGNAGPQREPAPVDAAWSRRIDTDAALLFRYSALTFNGHRIHYDWRYATESEGYPGLIVHGPLVATLLLDLLGRNTGDAELAAFSFRAVCPLFDTGPFWVCGQPQDEPKTVDLWARGEGGELALSARAVLR
jgi:3-methylfumaryl-CoA hydratase